MTPDHYDPEVILGSSTIARVVDRGAEDPTFVRRPVGFTAQLEPELPPVICYLLSEPLEQEPLLWDGDQA